MSGGGGVVLVNPKATHADEIAPKVFPPLGLLYLGAALERAGVPVEGIDANALRLDDDALVARIGRAAPTLIGIPVYAETLFATAKTARALRGALPRCRIVAGGPQASAAPAWVLAEIPEVDWVIAGEAEASLVKLAHLAAAGGAPDPSIPGLHWRGGRAHEPRAALTESLDDLPAPARGLVGDAYAGGKYYAVLVADRRLDCLLTSRGCPFACRFCYNHRRTVRTRSVDSCLEELEQLRARGVRTVEILDDNFVTPEERAIELLDRMARERTGIRFRVKARADAITARLVAAARRAGVYQISIGTESGSPRILRAMDKRITVGGMLEAAARVMQSGIYCHTGWILGYPGETPETIAETIDVVRRMRPTTAGFAILVPYPGTAVYEQARTNGTLEGDWSAATAAVPWVRLPWVKSYAALRALRRRVMRRVYLRPHYAFEYGRMIVGGANWTMARYAAQELGRVLRSRGP